MVEFDSDHRRVGLHALDTFLARQGNLGASSLEVGDDGVGVDLREVGVQLDCEDCCFLR